MAQWWDEMAVVADEEHVRFSRGWYAAMRDMYVERFPDADARSLQNMNDLVEWAKP